MSTDAAEVDPLLEDIQALTETRAAKVREFLRLRGYRRVKGADVETWRLARQKWPRDEMREVAFKNAHRAYARQQRGEGR